MTKSILKGKMPELFAFLASQSSYSEPNVIGSMQNLKHHPKTEDYRNREIKFTFEIRFSDHAHVE